MSGTGERTARPRLEPSYSGCGADTTTAWRNSSSASGEARARISSPTASTVSGTAITTWPSRMMATIAESGGRRSSYRGRPAFGDSSGSLISTSVTCPFCRRSSRTRSPTETASSTSEVRMWGGDTESSTPHWSVNIHSFFGWLTRASTLGTPYSCFDSSEITRLSSSSPVAATTTSASATWAFSRTHSSQASPRTTSTPGAVLSILPAVRGSCSISVIWCPCSLRSAARCRPTAPPPATMTFTRSFLRQRGQQVVEDVHGLPVHDDVGHVTLLEGAPGLRDEPLAAPLHARHDDLLVGAEDRDRLAHQVAGNDDPQPEQVPAAQRLLDLLTAVEQHQHDLLRRPLDAGDGGDVQPLVDLRPPGVVDPGDHRGHVVVLPRHPGRQDVRVVPGGDRDERVGVLDAGFLEVLAIEPDAHEPLGIEPRRQAVQRLPPLVDDRDLVPGLRELHGELRADPAAPHDQDLHQEP